MATTPRRKSARSAHRLRGVVAIAVAALSLSSCVASVPPAQTVGNRQDSGPVPQTIDKKSATVVLEDFGSGFNPHLVTDLGIATTALADLTMPSVFVTDGKGARVPNATLLESVTTISGDPERTPFTVQFVVRDVAQWNDGVPIGAEDFHYLWQRMNLEPAAVDPYGYSQISDVRSSNGGKTVTIDFSGPYGHWRSLFEHLIPAHFAKDAPGGFQEVFDDTIPVSGGPFMIRSIDLGRGEILLVRNDRYWDPAAKLENVVFRRVSESARLAQSLRSGDGDIVIVSDTPVNRVVLETMPTMRSALYSAPFQLELAANAATGPMAKEPVRRAVLGALNASAPASIATGLLDPLVSPQLRREDVNEAAVPSAGIQSATAMPDALIAEGYSRDSGWWSKAGTLLSLTIGVDRESGVAVAAAHTVVDELKVLGIAARVYALGGPQLYKDALPAGVVDLSMTWQRTDGPRTSMAHSRFSCPHNQLPREKSTENSGTSDSLEQPQRSSRSQALTTLLDLPPLPPLNTAENPPTTTTLAAKPVSRVVENDRRARAVNVTGVCDSVLQSRLGQLNTTSSQAQASPELLAVRERVQELALILPIVQPVALVAVRRSLTGVQGVPSDRGADVGELFSSVSAWSIS